MKTYYLVSMVPEAGGALKGYVVGLFSCERYAITASKYELDRRRDAGLHGLGCTIDKMELDVLKTPLDIRTLTKIMGA